MVRLVGSALVLASVAFVVACAPRGAEEVTADRIAPSGAPANEVGSAPISPEPREEPTGERVRSAPGEARGLDAGLDWLASHQSPDGGWDGDTGATGLATLAFLGAGETHQSGNHRETVKRGLAFLRGRQDADGCVGPRGPPAELRDHALAAVALCEAYGLTGSGPLQEPARRSVAFALTTRTPGDGWHRAAADGGGLDVVATGWMVMLLRSARMCELGAHDEEIAEAVAHLRRLVDPVTGRSGDAFGRADTAIVLLSRILAGHAPRTHPDLRRIADAVLAEPPSCATTADVERTYFGTMAIYPFGGDRWRRWSVPTREALLAAQCRDRGDRGSGSWTSVRDGTATSAVRTTSLCCMALEAWLRLGDMEGWRRDTEKWNE